MTRSDSTDLGGTAEESAARESSDPSRRAVLGTTVATLAGLAGCSAVRDRLSGETTSYDGEALRAIVEEPLPRSPSILPVSVPEELFAHHQRRARDLLDAVPRQPDVPNGAVARRLAAERAEVANSLSGVDDEEVDARADSDLERLWEWRNRREAAARIAGAYRAATGEAERATTVERSEQLRRNLLDFRQTWTYEVDQRPGGVVFHRELESMVTRCHRRLVEWPPFPTRPLDAAFAVGEIAGNLEETAAVLGDARRLRARYTDGETVSYRYGITTAAARLEGRIRSTDETVERLLRESEEQDTAPFDRTIEGTPAGRVWRATLDSVRQQREAVVEFAGPATAFLSRGVTLAGREVLPRIATEIREGGFNEPSSADAVRKQYRKARQALQAAWTTATTALSAPLARPAYESFRRASSELNGIDGRDIRQEQVVDAYGWLLHAQRHAEVVPTVVGQLRAALPARTEGSP